MSALSKFLPSAPPAPPVLLPRADVFFTRRVALAPDAPVADQIALALEGMAPFPPDQLYHGHLPAADGLSALVFAAFRRRFTAEETDAWAEAALVTSEFVPLLAARPSGDGVTVHVGDGRIIAAAWKQGEDLPSVVLARMSAPENSGVLAGEALARAGLPAYAEVRSIEGAPAIRAVGEAGYEAWAGEMKLGDLPASWVGGADVRDPEFLAERRRAGVRDLWLWRGLLGAAALFVLAGSLTVGASVLGFVAGRREAQVVRQKTDVEQIEAAQTLANRIGELSKKRLMPFEMLALINPARPDSIVFQRFITRGLVGLEVEATAANAGDVGAYAKALQILPGLVKVDTRDVRSREGVTTFVLALEFKPEALRNGGGQ